MFSSATLLNKRINDGAEVKKTSHVVDKSGGESSDKLKKDDTTVRKSEGDREKHQRKVEDRSDVIVSPFNKYIPTEYIENEIERKVRQELARCCLLQEEQTYTAISGRGRKTYPVNGFGNDSRFLDPKGYTGLPDFHRDTMIRYLGYGHAAGSLFNRLFPKNSKYILTGSYGITGAYVMADTLSKIKKANRAGKNKLTAAVDALVWQSLATIILPGIIINRLYLLHIVTNIELYFTNNDPNRLFFGFSELVKKSFIANGPYSARVLQILPVVIGFVLIPLISRPIDIVVDAGMNYTYRALFDQKPGRK